MARASFRGRNGGVSGRNGELTGETAGVTGETAASPGRNGGRDGRNGDAKGETASFRIARGDFGERASRANAHTMRAAQPRLRQASKHSFRFATFLFAGETAIVIKPAGISATSRASRRRHRAKRRDSQAFRRRSRGFRRRQGLFGDVTGRNGGTNGQNGENLKNPATP